LATDVTWHAEVVVAAEFPVDEPFDEAFDDEFGDAMAAPISPPPTPTTIRASTTEAHGHQRRREPPGASCLPGTGA
jgi:hypothetical protein